METFRFLGPGLLALAFFAAPAAAQSTSLAKVWRTSPDDGLFLATSDAGPWGKGPGQPATTVVVDPRVRYQSMAGFGASMTDASSSVLDGLAPADRDRAMAMLFDRDRGIGISLLRQPMGASDFARSIFSYDEGSGFSLARDEEHTIPLLKRALAFNPELTLIGSPWSPPAWMKTGGTMLGADGGVLKPEAGAAYAEYFARWIEGYTAAGLKVVAVTPQNEPAYGPRDYPGMVWSAQEEGAWVRDHLGPLLARRAPAVKILGWDHNWDRTLYARDLLDDPTVAKWLAGTAWHHYGGGPEAMSTIREAYPDKEIWFTEGGSGRWIANNGYTGKFKAGILEGIRIAKNWSRSIIWWNLMLDAHHGPTVMPNNANDGLLTAGALDRPEAGYFALGHFSKFVRPGAVRIGLGADNGDLEAVAFLNPDGTKVLVAGNRFSSTQVLRVQEGDQWLDLPVAGDSGLTLVW